VADVHVDANFVPWDTNCVYLLKSRQGLGYAKEIRRVYCRPYACWVLYDRGSAGSTPAVRNITHTSQSFI
jgi:hypothetical protein